MALWPLIIIWYPCYRIETIIITALWPLILYDSHNIALKTGLIAMLQPFMVIRYPCIASKTNKIVACDLHYLHAIQTIVFRTNERASM